MTSPRHRRNSPARPLYATLAALAVIAGLAFIATGRTPVTASGGAPAIGIDQIAQACRDRLGQSPRPTPAAVRTWLQNCASADVRVPTSSPSGTPTLTPPPTTTTTPPTTTAPPPTTVPPTSTPPGPGECPAFPAFPDASCTGWQHTGATLKACASADGYLETAGATYDGCLFPSGVMIAAPGITISRSRIVGVVRVHWSRGGDYGGLVLRDVEIDGGPNPSLDYAAVSAGNHWSCLRCDVHGTATGLHIGDYVTVTDSYVHDFVDSGSHGAAAGTGQGAGDHTAFIHNNLQCNRTNGAVACSAALALYDEPTLTDVLVRNNLFNSISGFCAYGGNSGTFIRFESNVFGRKYHQGCGLYGPITAWRGGNEGNVWTGNTWPDGSPVIP